MAPCEKYKDIDKRVTKWIDGKHGRIGVIFPEQKATEQEWIDFNIEFAKLIFKHASSFTN